MCKPVAAHGCVYGNRSLSGKFLKGFSDAASRSNIHTSTQPSDDAFTAMAAAGTLPDFCFVWSPSGYDEHAPDRRPDPAYVTKGQNLSWQRVDSVVEGGRLGEHGFPIDLG